MRTVSACRSWPMGELWFAVSWLSGFAVRRAGSIAFPQGSLWRERPPTKRGGKVRNLLRNCHPCSVAHFGGAMAKQTWKERMEDKQDGAIKALVAA